MEKYKKLLTVIFLLCVIVLSGCNKHKETKEPDNITVEKEAGDREDDGLLMMVTCKYRLIDESKYGILFVYDDGAVQYGYKTFLDDTEYSEFIKDFREYDSRMWEGFEFKELESIEQEKADEIKGYLQNVDEEREYNHPTSDVVPAVVETASYTCWGIQRNESGAATGFSIHTYKEAIGTDSVICDESARAARNIVCNLKQYEYWKDICAEELWKR